MKFLLTGGAGGIGYHATLALVSCGHDVAAIDDLNAYSTTALKRARVSLASSSSVYGDDTQAPSQEPAHADHPVSSNISRATPDFGFVPRIPRDVAIPRFVA